MKTKSTSPAKDEEVELFIPNRGSCQSWKIEAGKIGRGRLFLDWEKRITLESSTEEGRCFTKENPKEIFV